MSYVFKPAVRESCPLLIGLVGPSGCGKTFSALRLATGIQKVRGGNIVAVDTEARRALHYADQFKFLHCEFKEPFGSLNYAEIIKAAAKESAGGIVIVDSMSHEHEGVGGYLMFHDAECERLGGGEGKKAESVSWRAWAKPAANRRILINTILQIPAAFIFCFRAKEKSAMFKNSNGKYEIASLGWQAISGDEFVFEQTVRCLLPAGAEGVADWSAIAKEHGVPKCPEALRAIMLNSRPLDEKHGEELALWAAGKKSPERPREAGKDIAQKAEEIRNTPASPAPAKSTEPESGANSNSFLDWQTIAYDLGKGKLFDARFKALLAEERVKNMDNLAGEKQQEVVKKLGKIVQGWQEEKKK